MLPKFCKVQESRWEEAQPIGTVIVDAWMAGSSARTSEGGSVRRVGKNPARMTQGFVREWLDMTRGIGVRGTKRWTSLSGTKGGTKQTSLTLVTVEPQSPPCATTIRAHQPPQHQQLFLFLKVQSNTNSPYPSYPIVFITTLNTCATWPTPKSRTGAADEKPYPMSDRTTTWNAGSVGDAGVRGGGSGRGTECRKEN
ncbi:hypothetical protein M427DRAFT_132437 [Gonapodya prolifera JEL478]|uniref:Uncharacterized protein n=1 Tax=Gonapodya prolifera (strain JEL478) TaxID=1344416 RepID=A0A139AQJ8_GONPJ|nr:hypothetical protein M427DRAFT_132437 [Gonapodya prolifera JEL478]|eukprot:KXS18934.1 hypothetical protein M427DRAFT_132437 [Gonapodya prolifera JEL478]